MVTLDRIADLSDPDREALRAFSAVYPPEESGKWPGAQMEWSAAEWCVRVHGDDGALASCRRGLLITSAHGKPALGTWRYEGGRLTMVEEGIPYPVEILKLSGDEFRIRSKNPGEPVEMALVPAERPAFR